MTTASTAMVRRPPAQLTQAVRPESRPPARRLHAARRAAVRELGRASGCGCGESLLHHVHRRLGSTLFFDDDPQSLLQAFSAAEQVFITQRVLAACIVLTGKERIALYTTRSPQRWPALQLLAAADPTKRR